MPYSTLHARDVISKKPVDDHEIEGIVDRLHTSHTVSYDGGKVCKYPPPRCTNSISRGPASEEEMKEIYTRLHSAHTKSSKGGKECKTYEDPKPTGYGQRQMPVIEGLEQRFNGANVPSDKAKEAMARLHGTQTKCSQAKLDNPKILLYPERTKLMNNPERIVHYQNTGSVVKQVELARREKWFN